MVFPPGVSLYQFRRLSSRWLLDSLRRRLSLLRLDESLDVALAITTGWWSGLLRILDAAPDALAAACFSHMSLDLTQMSSICSWGGCQSRGLGRSSVCRAVGSSHLSSKALAW